MKRPTTAVNSFKPNSLLFIGLFLYVFVQIVMISCPSNFSTGISVSNHAEKSQCLFSILQHQNRSFSSKVTNFSSHCSGYLNNYLLPIHKQLPLIFWGLAFGLIISQKITKSFSNSDLGRTANLLFRPSITKALFHQKTSLLFYE